MAAWLNTQGHAVNRKRVQRLMRLMGLVAIYQRPNTSKAAAEHIKYPYLLGGLTIDRVNQVWCSDITYIPMPGGFLYLVVIMDAVRFCPGACPTPCRLLCRGAGGGAARVRTARDLQHRSRQPVHQR